MKRTSWGARLKKRIDAAQGRAECDLVLRNVRYLDVFSCEWKNGDVSIADGAIVGLEAGPRAPRVFDGTGKTVVPGFLDAHVHVESSMMVPGHFQDAVLPRGTTTAICDPHEITNVAGKAGLGYFLDSATELDMDLWVMLSSCVPSTHLETNGGGVLSASDLASVADHPRALGLAEMMNVPGVLSGAPDVLRKLEVFADVPLDGHCPMLSGASLSAYASAGITSCHESTELAEAKEKLTKGIACWIREGSVAKDLKRLAPILTLATSTSVGFCTDDRNPLDILTEGHIDFLIREAIASGVAPEVAYRSASWSVARHYGLAQGPGRIGAVAPGYVADLVVLDDVKSCAIHGVLKSGRWVRELEKGGRAHAGVADLKNTLRARAPLPEDLEGPSGRVHVLGVIPGKLITTREVTGHRASGVAHLSVLERYGHGSRPANGYVRGFGEKFDGAIASSVGHDSHNLIAVGSNTRDMSVAMAALIECGGGFCVARGGAVVERLPLPFGGLMSELDARALMKPLQRMKAAGRAVGCTLSEPFLQLAFLSLPVIPSLKLTDKGLVDVDAFRIIDVRAS